MILSDKRCTFARFNSDNEKIIRSKKHLAVMLPDFQKTKNKNNDTRD